jgi:hypothetical protein
VLLTIAEYCVRVRVKLGSGCLGLQIAGSCANQFRYEDICGASLLLDWCPSAAAYRYTHHRGG